MKLAIFLVISLLLFWFGISYFSVDRVTLRKEKKQHEKCQEQLKKRIVDYELTRITELLATRTAHGLDLFASDKYLDRFIGENGELERKKPEFRLRKDFVLTSVITRSIL